MAKQICGEIPGLQKFSMPLEAAASAAASTSAASVGRMTPAKAIRIKGAKFIPEAALTGAATNYCTLSLRNLGTNGAGTKDIASLAFSGTGVTAAADVAKALTLSATAADLLVAAGEVLAWHIAQAGTGMAYPKHHPVFDYEWQ